MQIPLQITYRHMDPSTAIDTVIREKAEKLERFADDIIRCRVTIEAPHKHHHKGRIYVVKIDVTVPGEELVASRNPDKDHAHEDVYVALRDAFDAMRRQLEDYVRRRRNKVKRHEPGPHGVITRLLPEEDHGFIETPDGREIYFHRNSVINADFDRLGPGTPVRFAEEMGDQGPQASTVQVEGKHHRVGE